MKFDLTSIYEQIDRDMVFWHLKDEDVLKILNVFHLVKDPNVSTVEEVLDHKFCYADDTDMIFMIADILPSDTIQYYHILIVEAKYKMQLDKWLSTMGKGEVHPPTMSIYITMDKSRYNVLIHQVHSIDHLFRSMVELVLRDSRLLDALTVGEYTCLLNTIRQEFKW